MYVKVFNTLEMASRHKARFGECFKICSTAKPEKDKYQNDMTIENNALNLSD